MSSHHTEYTESLPEPLLEYLLDPIPISAFLAAHWGNRALVIRGSEAKFAFLFNPDGAWERLALSRTGQPPRMGAFDELKICGSLDGGKSEFRVRPEDAAVLAAGGAALVAEKFEIACGELAAAVEQIRKELHFVGEIGFRVRTLPGHDRYAMRNDSAACLVNLVRGSGQWKYSKELARDWPEASGIAVSKPLPRPVDVASYNSPDDCSFESVNLNTGDALWLPAGCWYEISTDISLTAVELVFTSHGGFYGSFEPAMKHILQTMAGWRAPLPPLPFDQLDQARAPADIHAIYRDRLQELLTVVDLFREHPDIIDQAWSNLVGSFSVPVTTSDPCISLNGGPFPSVAKFQLALSGTKTQP